MPLAAPRTLADPQSPEPPSSPLGAPCTPADLQHPCAPQQPPRPPALHSPLCPPRPLGTPLGAPAGPCTPTASRRPRRHPPPVPSCVPPFRIPVSLRPPAGGPRCRREAEVPLGEQPATTVCHCVTVAPAAPASPGLPGPRLPSGAGRDLGSGPPPSQQGPR
ncbi:vegetative cell wall protein gp1-like [Vulpes lagopus]|uniref:vegetative cell wall protein gp1-like n=1 Tax=Vulpes lagopus TaxID=494514 RepID=UPI001BCA1061|nr:vegetative cell wall protein gp1-like [Vulpes lagopus]